MTEKFMPYHDCLEIQQHDIFTKIKINPPFQILCKNQRFIVQLEFL